MAPPIYSDLGKCARDLFDKGFNHGFMKLDCKTSTISGVEFTTKGSSSNEDGKISASIEAKHKKPDYGLTFSEKWTSDNTIASELAIEDQIATGFKLTFCSSFSPSSGKKGGSVKTAYRRDNMSFTLDTNLDFTGPVIQGSVVGEYEGWMAGHLFGLDTANAVLTKNNFAAGYCGADYQLLCNVNDLTEFSGTIYQSVSSNLATGIQLAWTAGQENTRFGIASKYNIDSDASLSLKLNNTAQLGIGYTRMLSAGVKMTASTLLETKDFNAGGHKFGIGFEFEI